MRPTVLDHREPHDLQMVVQRRPGELLGQCSCGQYEEGASVALLQALVRAHQPLAHGMSLPAQR